MTMTTAQHRNAAREAAAAINWIEAAEHLEAAISKHPCHNRNGKPSAMDQMDMNQMAERAATYRLAA
jgi:hypothetical protein